MRVISIPGVPGSTRKSFCSPSMHRGDDVEARVALARDEPLLAVQHPVVAVAVGRRCERRQVGAGPRLGQRPRLAVLAAHDRHHVLLDLRRRQQLEQLARAAVDDGEPEAVRRLARLLLERHLAEHREIAAAERGRHVEHREPGRPRLDAQRIDLGGVDRVPLDDPLLDGIDLILDEAADLPFQLGDVGGKLGHDHGRPPGTFDRTVRNCVGSVAGAEDLVRGPQPARERAVHQRLARDRPCARRRRGTGPTGHHAADGGTDAGVRGARSTDRRPRSRGRRRPARAPGRVAAARASRATPPGPSSTRSRARAGAEPANALTTGCTPSAPVAVQLQ